ncbi:MAG: porin family protein [Ferruginibacter sp.]
MAIAFTTFSHAQFTPGFGIKAGLSSAGMRGDAIDNFKGLLDFADGRITTADRTGFFAGIFTSLPLDKMISIEPGVYYSQKGYVVKGALSFKGTEFLNATSKLQSGYLDIPLLVKADIDGFQIFVGPQFSYLMKAEVKSTAGLLGFNLLNNTMNVTDQFNRWDMAITGGVGYKFSNGINISAAYDHGLSKVDANKNINSYNRSFKIGLGINF